MVARSVAIGVSILAVFSLPACDQRPAAPPAEQPGEPARPRPRWRQITNDALARPPRDEYEATVKQLFIDVYRPNDWQNFCSQWFPARARAAADSANAWRERNATVLGDVDDHMHAIWTRDIAAEFKVEAIQHIRYAHRKRMADEMNAGFDDTPVAEAEEGCLSMVAGLSSPKWNLEKRYAKELAVMRAREIERVVLPGKNVVAKEPAQAPTSAGSPGP